MSSSRKLPCFQPSLFRDFICFQPLFVSIFAQFLLCRQFYEKLVNNFLAINVCLNIFEHDSLKMFQRKFIQNYLSIAMTNEIIRGLYKIKKSNMFKMIQFNELVNDLADVKYRKKYFCRDISVIYIYIYIYIIIKTCRQHGYP